MSETSKSWREVVVKAIAATAVFAVANITVYSKNSYFDHMRDYRSTVNGLFARPDVTRVLVGDSHVAKLNQTSLDADVYNLAAPGDSLRECYAKLRYVLGRHTHIRTVLLSIDLNMFGTGRLRSANGAFADQYLVLSNSPYGLNKGRLGGIFNAVPLFNDDFVQYTRARIHDALTRKMTAADKPTEPPWFKLSKTERAARAQRTGTGDHSQVGQLEEPFAWIARIVALTRAHNIVVIGVRYPAHPDYFSTVSRGDVKRMNDRLVRSGLNEIRDLRYAFNDPKCFEDPDHVSPAGATTVARLLGLSSAPASPSPCVDPGAAVSRISHW
jgi:hypothetical protein